MILTVLSDSSENQEELELINFFFENGLDIYHLRKRNFSRAEMKTFLDGIPKEYHSKIVIHSHYSLALKYKLLGIHISRKKRKSKYAEWFKTRLYKLQNPNISISTSYSQLTNFDDKKSFYDYVFLSPIFDTISNAGYGSHFNLKLIELLLSKTPEKIIALGGVDASKIEKLESLGFYGVAVSGAIWESADPKKAFIEIKNQFSK